MTGYDRIRSAFDNVKTDRVPMMLHAFMPAVREMGISMEEYRNSPENIAEAHIRFARKYGLDGVLIDIDTCMLASAIGVPTDYPRDIVARTKGVLSTDIRQVIEMVDPEKLKKSERIKINLEAIYKAKQKAKGEILVRGNCDQMAFSLAMLAYGMSDFLGDLLDEDREEELLELIDRAYQVHLEFQIMMHEAGADITSFGDSPAGPDMVSRDVYMKFANPYHKKLKNELDKRGIKTVCHICGNIDKIMEDIADVGFAGVEIDYKTNLEKAAPIFWGKSLVFGPIDPSEVFYKGRPDLVVNETKRALNIFRGRGIVIGAGCALAPDTPEENIHAFTETVRKYKK